MYFGKTHKHTHNPRISGSVAFSNSTLWHPGIFSLTFPPSVACNVAFLNVERMREKIREKRSLPSLLLYERPRRHLLFSGCLWCREESQIKYQHCRLHTVQATQVSAVEAYCRATAFSLRSELLMNPRLAKFYAFIS